MFTIEVPAKLAAEVRTEEIDFAPYLPFGSTIDSVAVATTVYSGTAGVPGSFLQWSSTIGYSVYVRLTGGSLGTIYSCTVTAILAAGDRIACTFLVAIVPEAT